MRLYTLPVLALAAFAITVQAQIFRGGITGMNYTTTSSSDGVFSFQDLPLGLYNVEVEASRPYFAQYPNFGVIDEIQSIGTSNYNSFQASLRTTSWHNLISQFSYAWSHNLDEVTRYVGALPQDSTQFKNDYGNSDLDVRHHSARI